MIFRKQNQSKISSLVLNFSSDVNVEDVLFQTFTHSVEQNMYNV